MQYGYCNAIYCWLASSACRVGDTVKSVLPADTRQNYCFMAELSVILGTWCSRCLKHEPPLGHGLRTTEHRSRSTKYITINRSQLNEFWFYIHTIIGFRLSSFTCDGFKTILNGPEKRYWTYHFVYLSEKSILSSACRRWVVTRWRHC